MAQVMLKAKKKKVLLLRIAEKYSADSNSGD